MAAAAACKRVGQIGTNSGINVIRFGGFGASERAPPSDFSSVQLWPSMRKRFDCRQISQLVTSNGRRLFLVDTLALVTEFIEMDLLLPFIGGLFPCVNDFSLRYAVFRLGDWRGKVCPLSKRRQ